MHLRRYTSADCPEMAQLFYETVHCVNARDYSPEQLDAWADGNVDLDRWNSSFMEHDTWIAVEDNQIAGFGDVDHTGYLDRLYVHKDYQGRGIAGAICDKLEQSFPADFIETHASKTARPFFERRGYIVVKEQQVERHGVYLTNYVMKKAMTNTPVLETARLRLRKFTQNDLESLYKIFRDEEVNRFLPWYPVKSMEEAYQWWLDRYLCAYGQVRGYKYAICLKSDDIPIGYINVSTKAPYDLGYGLQKAFWHQGIVTEAAKTVIERVQKDGIPFITATHDRNNPRSGNVMIRLGMKYQYSYEELWQPKNIPVIFRLYQLNLDGIDQQAYKGYWNSSSVHFIEKPVV